MKAVECGVVRGQVRVGAAEALVSEAVAAGDVTSLVAALRTLDALLGPDAPAPHHTPQPSSFFYIT
eukprot:3215663-Rhodomonas_salina.1